MNWGDLRWIPSCAAAAALQLLLGMLLLLVLARAGSRRRWRRGWALAAHDLRGLVASSAALLALLCAVGWITGSALSVEPFHLIAPGVFSVCASPLAIGIAALFAAGRREARGSCVTSRAVARVGGQIAFFSAAACVVLLGAGLFALSAAERDALLTRGVGPAFALMAGSIALGMAGFVALLAGLAGKPRPSAGFAAALYVTSLAAFCAAAPAARAALVSGARAALALTQRGEPPC